MIFFPPFPWNFNIFFSHAHTSVCACICWSVRDILCLYLCVYSAGRMNPNEIFYGPVDLLIVPQVLSLLTPNLLETTCWARFFYLYPFFLPSSLFIPFFFSSFALPQGDLSGSFLKLALHFNILFVTRRWLHFYHLWVSVHSGAFDLILSLHYSHGIEKVTMYQI